MRMQFSRGVEGTRRSGRWTQPWSYTSLSAIVFVLATFVAFSGCDKPPTFSELINGKKKEAAPAPAPQVAKTQTPPPKQEVAKEPEPPKRSPQEIINEFNTTPSERRNNKQLIELASNPDAADQITELYLGNAIGVNDAGLAMMPKFEKVEKLAIDGCQYTNNALANIAKMKSLTALSMNGGSVQDPSHNCDAGLAAIKQMHQLVSLSLESSNLTPQGLAHIAEMTQLESLNVAHTRFNDDSLQLLAPLVNLKELNISFTMVGDQGFRFLLPFTQLENLKIAHIPIHGDGLRDYTKLKGRNGLKALTMFELPALELPGYEGIYNCRKTLEYLDLGQAVLSDERFVQAVIPCTKLETLLVHENPSFGDGGLSQVGRLKNLKRVFFYKNPAITDGSIPNLAKLKKLESITMNATGITEQGARALKKRLPKCDVVHNDKRVE
jgi:hypothetical protein